MVNEEVAGTPATKIQDVAILGDRETPTGRELCHVKTPDILPLDIAKTQDSLNKARHVLVCCEIGGSALRVGGDAECAALDIPVILCIPPSWFDFCLG